MKKYLVCLSGIFLVSCVFADDNPAVEVMQEYLDFAEYSEGLISTEQLSSIEKEDIFFVDVRNRENYEEAHIPGAVNIEWRQVLARRNEIPTDTPVVLYCETGILSSRAQFALRVAGRDNVKVLLGGFLKWGEHQGFEEARSKNGNNKTLQSAR